MQLYLICAHSCFSSTEPLTITGERLSVDPVRFSCVSRGLPSTRVVWTVPPEEPDPEIYQISRRLRDGTTSTYDTILTVYLDLERTLIGYYTCDIRSDERSQAASRPTSTVCEYT